MNLNLTDDQLKFLESEFSLKEADISRMTLEEWHKVREDSFDVEVEEALKEETGEEIDWWRCNTAASIADIMYSQLHGSV